MKNFLLVLIVMVTLKQAKDRECRVGCLMNRGAFTGGFYNEDKDGCECTHFYPYSWFIEDREPTIESPIKVKEKKDAPSKNNYDVTY